MPVIPFGGLLLPQRHPRDNGARLAAVNPDWMRFAAKARPARFAQFAQRISDVPAMLGKSITIKEVNKYAKT
jgi:alcohol dehydrogenase YqhD (iron-dependent ADH family)